MKAARTPMKRAALRALGLAAVALLCASAAGAQAAYTVTLHNGNTFLSKYEPVPATWDPDYVTFMTDVGNIISLHKDEIADVVSEMESRGFGTIINTTTVLIGDALNDNPTEEEAQAALDEQRAQPNFGFDRPVYNTTQFGEPSTVGSQSTGGLPVGFAMSGSGGPILSPFN